MQNRSVPYTLITANPQTGGGDPDIVEYDVDMPSLSALYQFYRKDPHINKARQRKLHETFRASMSVGYWDMNAEQPVELNRVELLNNERYQRLLRNFLAEAHDHLMLFGFVGYYCVRDMEAWVAALPENDDPTNETALLFDDQDEDVADPLPFGIIHLGMSDMDQYGAFKLQQRRGEMRRRLVFECTDEDLLRNYDFYVFDHDAAFEQMEECTLGKPSMLVITPFLELWQRRRELDEIRCCGLDGNFQGSHPESFVIVKPPAEVSVEKISETVRYTQDTLASAAWKNNARRIELNTALVNEQLDRLQSQQGRINSPSNTLRGTGIDPRGPLSLYTARKRAYARPDVKETLEVLPESMELARGPAPTILLSAEAAVYQYEAEVCSVMCFPIEFLGTKRSADSSGSGSGAQRHNEADLVFSQRQLDEEVSATHALFHNLFAEAYARTLGQLERFVPQLRQRKSRVRLHFDHQASKPDTAVLQLVPLVDAGILGEDEVRAAVLKNYNMKDEESVADKALRKKRLAQRLTPQQSQQTTQNAKKKKQKVSVSVSSASSSSSSSSPQSSEEGESSTATTKKKKRASSASSSEEKKKKKKKQKSDK